MSGTMEEQLKEGRFVGGEGDGGSDDEQLKHGFEDAGAVPTAVPSHSRPTPRMASNTGPKGVLNDYHQAQQQAAAERGGGDAEALAAAQAAAAQAAAQRKAAEEAKEKEKEKKKSHSRSSSSASSFIDSEDEAFFASYREQQISRMETARREGGWGALKFLDSDTFIDFVDSAPAEAFVVIHMYKDSIASCVRLNRILEDPVAPMHAHLRFGAISAQEAKGDSYDDVALPTVLIYRGGEVASLHVRVTDYLGGGGENATFTAADVEKFLRVTCALPMKPAIDEAGGDDDDE